MTKNTRFKRALAVACMAAAMTVAGCATAPARLGESGPDAELAASISQRLAVDPMFRDQLFGVEAFGGEVTVRGVVRSEVERMRLLSIVRGTPGVNVVNDRLRVVR